MKILMLMGTETPYKKNGGGGVYLDEVCKRLTEYDEVESVTVLCMDMVNPIEHFESKGKLRVIACGPIDALKHIGKSLNEIVSEIFFAYANRYLSPIDPKNHFDIIQCNESDMWTVAKQLRLLYRCPVVSVTHLSFTLTHMLTLGHKRRRRGLLSYFKKQPPLAPVYHSSIQNEFQMIHDSNAHLTVSEYYRGLLEGIFHSPKTVVVPNGVDFDLIQRARPNHELKRFIAWDRKLVIFCGRMVHDKGIDLIYELVPKFKDHFFLFISNIAPSFEKPFPLVRKMMQMIAKCGNARWVCSRDSFGVGKYEMMKAADCVIMPSRHEPFGIAGLEPMACGTPLITTAVHGMKEYANPSNCTIVEPTVKSIERALREHKRDDIKIQNALNTAREFSWDKTVSRLMEVYDATRSNFVNYTAGRKWLYDDPRKNPLLHGAGLRA